MSVIVDQCFFKSDQLLRILLHLGSAKTHTQYRIQHLLKISLNNQNLPAPRRQIKCRAVQGLQRWCDNDDDNDVQGIFYENQPITVSVANADMWHHLFAQLAQLIVWPTSTCLCVNFFPRHWPSQKFPPHIFRHENTPQTLTLDKTTATQNLPWTIPLHRLTPWKIFQGHSPTIPSSCQLSLTVHNGCLFVQCPCSVFLQEFHYNLCMHNAN